MLSLLRPLPPAAAQAAQDYAPAAKSPSTEAAASKAGAPKANSHAFTSVYIAPALEARRRVAKAFSALGHPTRLALLSRLTAGQTRSIVTLAHEVKLTRQTIMKHLDALEAAGLVRSRRVGRERQYTFQPGRAAEAANYLDDALREWRKLR